MRQPSSVATGVPQLASGGGASCARLAADARHVNTRIVSRTGLVVIRFSSLRVPGSPTAPSTRGIIAVGSPSQKEAEGGRSVVSQNQGDTITQLSSPESGMPNIPSWQAKKRRKLP